MYILTVAESWTDQGELRSARYKIENVYLSSDQKTGNRHTEKQKNNQKSFPQY